MRHFISDWTITLSVISLNFNRKRRRGHLAERSGLATSRRKSGRNNKKTKKKRWNNKKKRLVDFAPYCLQHAFQIGVQKTNRWVFCLFHVLHCVYPSVQGQNLRTVPQFESTRRKIMEYFSAPSNKEQWENMCSMFTAELPPLHWPVKCEYHPRWGTASLSYTPLPTEALWVQFRIFVDSQINGSCR